MILAIIIHCPWFVISESLCRLILKIASVTWCLARECRRSWKRFPVVQTRKYIIGICYYSATNSALIRYNIYMFVLVFLYSTLPFIFSACGKGKYGLNCNTSCNNCLSETCDPVEGLCKIKDTCKPGYLGSKCDQGIS